jgi:predicted nucleic acid-binding protein
VRILLDTNVVMSALFGGKPYLLEVIRQRGDVQLFSSTALLEELADVLARPQRQAARAHRQDGARSAG